MPHRKPTEKPTEKPFAKLHLAVGFSCWLLVALLKDKQQRALPACTGTGWEAPFAAGAATP